MRLYMNGKISVYQNTFIPSDLYLCTENCENTDIISDECIRLSGIETNATTDKENNWCVRWKGVALETAEKDFDEDFTLDMLKNIIRTKKLHVRNMEAYYDSTVCATIENIKIAYWNPETKQTEYYCFNDIPQPESIEFIGD